MISDYWFWIAFEDLKVSHSFCLSFPQKVERYLQKRYNCFKRNLFLNIVPWVSSAIFRSQTLIDNSEQRGFRMNESFSFLAQNCDVIWPKRFKTKFVLMNVLKRNQRNNTVFSWLDDVFNVSEHLIPSKPKDIRGNFEFTNLGISWVIRKNLVA